MTEWPPSQGEMARLIRTHDWAATPLGPIARWPQSLKTAVDMILGSGHAMQLAWGPERVILYNDAYAPMLGNRNPQALGTPFRQAWPEIWAEIEPLVAKVFAGETVKFDDMPLVMTRHGYPEQTWWSFSYSPVRDESGSIAGLLNVTVDATAKHLAQQARLESEERYRALFETMGQGYTECELIRDRAGRAVSYRVLDANPAWERLTGLPVAQCRGKDVLELLPDLEPFWIDLCERVVRHERSERVEHELAALHVWYDVSVYPAGGDRFNTLFDDITERKRAELVAQESHELQAFVLKLSDALRPIADPAQIKTAATQLIGEQLAVNRAFYADAEDGFWHVSPGYEHGVQSLPDRPFKMSEYGDWIVVGFEAGQRLVVEDMSTDRRFEPSERDAHLALQIGAEIAVPLVKHGRLVSMLVVQAVAPRSWSRQDHAILEEAAERTWAAVERARAEAALLASDRRKDEFLAVLGHELRNGLAPVVYNVEIGSRRADDPSYIREVFARSRRQLQHMVRLVDDLLDVARISTGKIQLNLEPVRVRDVVDLALDACRADIERRRHRLAVVGQAGSELLVHGDKVRLTQVVSNLLSNAAKYMEEGGDITVRIAQQDGQAVVEVRDTGIGIPPDSLLKVFDRFTQIQNQNAFGVGGLGIGLSLVKDFVEMQGGSVGASSEGLGLGSVFTVRLPVARATGPGERPNAAQDGAAAEDRALRVLVVDDVADSADALAELLRMEKQDVDVAYAGEEALASAHRRRPDMVLLDLGMPGMDGFEVARRLRHAFAGGPPMQIIALTGWGQDADRNRTKAGQFDGHMVKPIDIEELQAVLSAARRSLASAE